MQQPQPAVYDSPTPQLLEEGVVGGLSMQLSSNKPDTEETGLEETNVDQQGGLENCGMMRHSYNTFTLLKGGTMGHGSEKYKTAPP